MSSDTIRQEIVAVAKTMYDKGMVNAYEGNLSIRGGDAVYITPSAKCKGYLTPDMIVVSDMDGNLIEGDGKLSSEVKLHLAAYKLRGDLRAVIHSHSPYATAFAIAGRPIATKAYPEMLVIFGQIPIVEYGTPSTNAICAGIHRCIHEYDVFLLANHGIVAVGANLWDVYFRMEAAESIAKTLLLAEQAGGAVDLPDSEVELLLSMRDKRILRT
jgi:L-fuculose-phosphate aldolase